MNILLFCSLFVFIFIGTITKNDCVLWAMCLLSGLVLGHLWSITFI